NLNTACLHNGLRSQKYAAKRCKVCYISHTFLRVTQIKNLRWILRSWVRKCDGWKRARTGRVSGLKTGSSIALLGMTLFVSPSVPQKRGYELLALRTPPASVKMPSLSCAQLPTLERWSMEHHV